MSVGFYIHKYLNKLQPYQDDRSREWRCKINTWLLMMSLGLKCRPLLICGDNMEAFTGLFTSLSYSLFEGRQITIVSNSFRILNGEFDLPFDYQDDIRESQANLLILSDRCVTTYDDVIERFRKTKTNVLIFGEFGSYELNKNDERLSVITTKPAGKQNWSRFVDQICEEMDSLFEGCKFRRSMRIRTMPHMLQKGNDDIREWYRMMWTATLTNNGEMQFSIPSMLRLDVNKKRFERWMTDMNSLKDDICHYNLLVFDFTVLDRSRMLEMYHKLVKADPSGDSLIVYIVEDIDRDAISAEAYDPDISSKLRNLLM